jgi:nickel-dependent lactate racemase
MTINNAEMDDAEIREILMGALEGQVAGERVLILVPDHTRVLPLDRVLPPLVEAVHRAASVEVMVALGTHPADGVDYKHRVESLAASTGRAVPVRNHEWRREDALTSIGVIDAESIRQIAGKVWHRSLDAPLEVRINRAVIAADRVIILGPTLPHEVAGFSGGTKYLFPGISGPEMIDVMHWLGALSGVMATIGFPGTPVRELIDAAAALLPIAVTLVAVVTDGGGLAGLFVGPPAEAWPASVEQSSRLHISLLDRPYRRVVSQPMPIYDELWTAAKAAYKLEGAVTDGGELIVYAPWLNEVSSTHGKAIFEVGYHVLDYFLEQWEKFDTVPLAVLAHSSHVKGAGSFAGGREVPRISVQLATAISPGDCERLNLGYVDPASIDLDRAADADTLVVRDAGEHLWRAR